MTVTTKVLLPLLILLLMMSDADAADSPLQLTLSLGSSWQTSNEVQIPNDDQGTRFSLDEVTGSGPWPAVRLEGIWRFDDRHAARVLLAPLHFRETGSIDETIRFDGGAFNPDEPVTGEYRFNSWRVGYRYHLFSREVWDMWVGGTLKVRDAEIRLSQGAVRASDDDIGLVPLLYLAGEYRFGSAWSVAADLDGLAGGPGRAIDLGASLNYRTNDNWRLGLEYRVLEGGADTDDVYNFAWFNSMLLTAQYRP